MLTHHIHVGLGRRFRDLLITEAAVVAMWPMAELIQSRARSIVFDRNHGTWEGTGTVRGVPLTTIPDGEWGATFNGSGRVRVPHDGFGFHQPGDAGARTLSLANGSFDVVVVIKTVTNDATLRAIVQKQETNSSGNGWRVGLRNGAINLFLKVAGVVVFDFDRGAVADGIEHVIHGHYAPEENLARINIDGVASGADVAASTEPAVNTGDLIIGMLGDLAGGFIGTIGLPMIGREGNPGLGAALQPARAWTEITEDVRIESEPVQARHGFTGTDPLTRVAGPGSMTFALDNSAQNAAGLQGRYTPGHADALAGWQERIPVRWQISNGVTTYTRFRGTIKQIQPTPGLARGQSVSVIAETWFAQALRSAVGQIPVQIDLRSDDAVRYLIDQMERPPVAVEMSVGKSVFPIVFDDVSPESKALQTVARVMQSEAAYCYERVDGTLVVERRLTRYLTTDIDAVWDEFSLADLEAERDVDAVTNIVRGTLTPRRAGAVTTTVLASMVERIRVEPEESIAIELPYRDPAQTAARVGGLDVTVPVAVTDYSMTGAEDGTGDDLTAYATVEAATEDVGGSAARLRVTNLSADVGYFLTQVRGRALYRFDEVGFEERDDASVREFDPREDTLEMPYQADLAEARAIARQHIALRRVPVMAPVSAVLDGVDDALDTEILVRDMGDVVSPVETMTALDGTAHVFIHGIELTAGRRGILSAAYLLTRTTPEPAFWIVGEVGYAEVGETTRVA